ncbi:leucine-rich repeat domain-containing protein [Parabacteroides sp. AF48-14]|nr:leucine-rich repeat domain-containing protein [Parabacteroides sp. AF48-14]
MGDREDKEGEMMKKILLVLMGLCLCLNMKSQVTTYVEMKEMGTLLNLLTDQEIEQTEKIVIKGNSLMKEDFAVLKRMLVKYNLKRVDIENTATYVITEKAFDNCSSLKDIKLPKFLTTIGYMAFGNCDNLENIVFPSSLEKIDIGAFWFCSSLKSILLGRRLKSIGGDCFHHCTSLQEIHCQGEQPSVCAFSSFEGLHETCVLYVPEGCKRKYAFADGWLNFDNIREEHVESAYSLQVDLQGGTFAWQLYPDYEGVGGAVVQWIYPKEECFIEVEKSETVVFLIAEENTYFSNWRIEAILLNGEDITSQLTENMLLYLTINQDSKLEIKMKDLLATSNETIEERSIGICISSDGLCVSNVIPNELIRVYNLSGVLVCSKRAESDSCEIRLPKNQIYFLQVGTKVFKIKI